ncbi:protein of unknown function [Magnetospirillum sp. XM-1]|nr:protein of unknown function [Magnetospirillum sp. XM-1]
MARKLRNMILVLILTERFGSGGGPAAVHGTDRAKHFDETDVAVEGIPLRLVARRCDGVFGWAVGNARRGKQRDVRFRCRWPEAR